MLEKLLSLSLPGIRLQNVPLATAGLSSEFHAPAETAERHLPPSPFKAVFTNVRYPINAIYSIKEAPCIPASQSLHRQNLLTTSGFTQVKINSQLLDLNLEK